MKFLFASDISFHFFPEYPGNDKAKNAVSKVKKFFHDADFSIINLENVMGRKDSYIPISKCGPNLISTDNFFYYIKELNPSVIGLANNHTGDFGEEAIFHTLDLITKEGYQYIGAGQNITDAYIPYIAEKDGVKVGIIAVCENEFGGAKENKAGSAVYNLTRLKKGIDNLKEENIKPVIFFHGGNETNPFPSPGKKELYRHFVDLGASAVVAMHTHCPQGYEMYNNSPIIYSMGNFFFPHLEENRKNLFPTWYYGYLTELEFTESATKIKIIPYTFDMNSIVILENEALEHFNKYHAYISSVIKDDKKIENFFDSWCVNYCRANNPSIIFDESMIAENNPNIPLARNKFTCEAHNEVWENYYVLAYEKRIEESINLIEEIEILQNYKLKNNYPTA